MSPQDRAAALLATVVHVEGSAYGRSGSRLLIRPGSPHVGYISGGCLESDLVRKAPMLAKHGPALVSYDTRPGGAAEEFALGCEGVLHVLVEPLDRRGEFDPLLPLRRAYEADRPARVATIFHAADASQVGRRVELVDGCEDWRRQALAVADGGGGIVEVEGFVAFAEYVEPPRRLFVFGGAHDAPPLVQAVAAAGWRLGVIDRRPGRTAGEAAGRFVGAQTVHCQRPAEAVADLNLAGVLHERSAAVLMAHDIDDDAEALAALLATDIGYIGLLGPKRRTARVMLELRRHGVSLTAADLDRVHTPVGLDLGGPSPEEIAVAVTAELIAWHHGRPGGPLGQRMLPIHDQPASVMVGSV